MEGKEITAVMIKELRNKSGVGIMDCKEALKKCDGDIDKSFDYLRKKGIATASKRSGRAISEGIIQSYIHLGGKIGVMVEINCETDFVARTSEFAEFANNIAMHITAANPLGISSKDISSDVIEREKQIYKAQILEMGKPEKVADKIISGKVNKFLKENCLLDQQYVKENKKSILDYLNEMIAKTGEMISIKRFVRFEIGEN